MKPDGNDESLAPDYCNRIWGIIAETIRFSWDAATLPAANLTYDDIVPGDGRYLATRLPGGNTRAVSAGRHFGGGQTDSHNVL